MMKWADENPGWPEKIINSARDGTFSVYLRQVREAIGAANLNYRFLKMLEQLCEDAGELSPELKQQTREILGRAPETLVFSPREWNEDCNNLRPFILYFMLRDLESRYGEMAYPERTYITPLYSRQREENGVMNSQNITPDKSQPIARDFDYGVCIGWRYDSWEQFFYQVSHKAVHLLSPKLFPNGMMRTCALDEGMAVRFAEEMLAKYIPYVSRAFVESPVGLDNAYHPAWEAASKLSHDLLAQILSEFGSFGTIDDPVRFAAMTAPWLTTAEASLLSSAFRYS
ncbi:hypothetical protein ACTSFU_005403 [Klebsiella michiganensis]